MLLYVPADSSEGGDPVSVSLTSMYNRQVVNPVAYKKQLRVI